MSPQTQKIARFIISGGTAAASNLLILFVLVHFFHVYYLLSSILSFVGAVGVGFTLQKFWTFQDHGTAKAHTQFALFVVIAAINLTLNTGLMYIFVSMLGIWYLVAQVLAAAALAVTSYFAYKTFVFKIAENQTL